MCACVHTYVTIFVTLLIDYVTCFIMFKYVGWGIQSVFNLQQPGEHKNCGAGLEESSDFSYLPEDLISDGC